MAKTEKMLPGPSMQEMVRERKGWRVARKRAGQHCDVVGDGLDSNKLNR